MKVFMIGGTGLLGSQAADELIKQGHQVKTLALPPIPQGASLNPKMEIEFGNYLEMTDSELKEKMKGSEGFVFAAGVDERVEGKAPIYDLYKKYNIDPIYRLLRLGKEVGIKHVSICGSYFAYFAKTHPEWNLTEDHPYIRSRIDQEKAAMSFKDDMDVAVLELPYIFGTQPGRKPVWVFMAEMLLKAKKSVLYTRGGTTMVTVKQVGQALANALTYNKGGNCYPIGCYNMTWKELLPTFAEGLGKNDIQVKTIPDFLYTFGGKAKMKEYKKEGIDPGLDMVKFKTLQCANLFIDRSLGIDKLHVEDDDIKKAIYDSALLSKNVALKKVDVVNMKGE